ncbi:YusU family protein [Priestia taiwanensis]|uniref:DUF2573 domain-containing protein n=1 Tax=Priestia taiwanensis TaxID=1347902 RepID=A0A917AX22_9BACI|nr:YusU family protein [Priestia taiwanensis]MBM7364508.1 inorganic pyrophosphatase [Priestia taiwanensis]GGE80952.1 hypothetical protein GCM10007140_33110 [Priestia taiwanensis]
MEQKFLDQMDGLLNKYTELLLGETNPELKQKVEKWALYSAIAKSMPALAKHWNEQYPDAKGEMMKIIAEIKQLNDAHRANKKQENV